TAGAADDAPADPPDDAPTDAPEREAVGDAERTADATGGSAVAAAPLDAAAPVLLVVRINRAQLRLPSASRRTLAIPWRPANCSITTLRRSRSRLMPVAVISGTRQSGSRSPGRNKLRSRTAALPS